MGSKYNRFTAIIERCSDTGLYVGYVPNVPGAHSEGVTLDELSQNLKEVLELVLSDEEFVVRSEFIGTQDVVLS